MNIVAAWFFRCYCYGRPCIDRTHTLTQCVCVCVWQSFGNGLRDPHRRSQLPLNDSSANSACACVWVCVCVTFRPAKCWLSLHFGQASPYGLCTVFLCFVSFCPHCFKAVFLKMISVWMIYNMTVGMDQPDAMLDERGVNTLILL